MPFIISESDGGGDSSKERQHSNRRSRTNFNSWQLDELERAFLSCHYPDVFMREALALRLALRESRVAVSFNQQIQSREKQKEKNFWLSVTCSLLLADNQWESKPFTSESSWKAVRFPGNKRIFRWSPPSLLILCQHEKIGATTTICGTGAIIVFLLQTID